LSVTNDGDVLMRMAGHIIQPTVPHTSFSHQTWKRHLKEIDLIWVLNERDMDGKVATLHKDAV